MRWIMGAGMAVVLGAGTAFAQSPPPLSFVQPLSPSATVVVPRTVARNGLTCLPEPNTARIGTLLQPGQCCAGRTPTPR